MPLQTNDFQPVTIITYLLNIYYGMSTFIMPFNSHNHLVRRGQAHCHRWVNRGLETLVTRPEFYMVGR